MSFGASDVADPETARPGEPFRRAAAESCEFRNAGGAVGAAAAEALTNAAERR
jgi:hypothetical protein